MNRQSGVSLVELMVALALLAMAAAATTVNLEPAEQPLVTGSRLVEGFILQARSSAIATTSAYRVVPAGPSRLVAQYANDCGDATWTPEPAQRLELPDEVKMTATDWSICFSRRGVASANVTVTLTHPDRGAVQVEVLLGGATRVVP